MNCIECQNHIDSFIRGELDRKASSAFAQHVLSCEECYDELEINYFLQTAITDLSSDKEMSGDYKGRLRLLLYSAIEDYKKYILKLTRKRIFVLAIIVTIAYHLGLRY